MPWFLVIVAGLFEVAMAASLKLSKGFSAPLPTLFFVLFAAASFTLLSLALKNLDVGTAYTVWTGIGAIGTATLGILAFGEPSSPAKLLAIALILTGVLTLHLTGGH